MVSVLGALRCLIVAAVMKVDRVSIVFNDAIE
jgi:hypothetical protein